MGFLYQNSSFPILSLVTFVPLIGALLIVFFMRSENAGAIKRTALIFAIIDFLLSVPLWLYFDTKGTGDKLFQFRQDIDWIPQLGVRYIMAIDGIALLLRHDPGKGPGIGVHRDRVATRLVPVVQNLLAELCRITKRGQ